MSALHEVWPTTPSHGVEHEARMFKWHKFTPRNVKPCPWVLIGRRCRSGRDICICEKHSSILDHSYGWIDENGDYVQTAEPYSFTGDQILTLVVDLGKIGIDVHVSGRSLWVPGQTVLLVLRARQ